MAEVRLEKVGKFFREQMAVTDFCLEVRDKEFLVIVGPSGCGKTTLLRLIAGLEETDSGSIYINKTRVDDLPPRDRNIAMVFQNYALYPNMSVYDNLAFGLKMKRAGKEEIDAKVRAVAGMLNIDRYLNRKPAKLSGGERQRVAIGRALVRDPAVFLMDEPLSNLDTVLRNRMRTELLRLHRQLQATFIYVTHDQTEAMTLGDRIVVMQRGRIQQVDTPENIYNRPVNRFVAEFIGNPPMNFFPARLEGPAAQPYAVVAETGQILELSREKGIKLTAFAPELPREVVVGIRPEQIRVQPSAAGVNNLRLQIDIVERMGADLLLHMNMGQIPLVARIGTGPSLAADMMVDIDLPPQSLYLFDAQSGTSLLVCE